MFAHFSSFNHEHKGKLYSFLADSSSTLPEAVEACRAMFERLNGHLGERIREEKEKAEAAAKKENDKQPESPEVPKE